MIRCGFTFASVITLIAAATPGNHQNDNATSIEVVEHEKRGHESINDSMCDDVYYYKVSPRGEDVNAEESVFKEGDLIIDDVDQFTFKRVDGQKKYDTVENVDEMIASLEKQLNELEEKISALQHKLDPTNPASN